MAPVVELVETTETPTESSRWRSPFEAVLHQILKEYEGQDAKVRDGMETGMRKLFEKPYDVEIGALSGADSNAIGFEEAQEVIFFPRLSHMRLYVEVFRRHTPDDTARREKMLKFKMLSLLYTLHRKDGALVDRFMHCGGLDGLVALLEEDNVIIQSQAIELLMEMLSPLMQLPPATSSRQAHLHHKAYGCLCSGPFWRNIARIIAEPHETFPKSYSSCVRILAGAVGWLRPEGDDVPEAGCPSNVGVAAEAMKQFLDHANVPPEIHGVSEDLLQELLDKPTVRVDPLRDAELAAARKSLFSPDAESREDAAHGWQALRKVGNDAFKAGLVWPAEASYRLAMEFGGDVLPSSEASLIESNRALALLRAGHPDEAATAAASALQHDPNNVKAAYRRAQALLEQSDGKVDVSMVRGAVEAAELAARIDPKDIKIADMLRVARTRLEELGGTEAQERMEEEASLEVMD